MNHNGVNYMVVMRDVDQWRWIVIGNDSCPSGSGTSITEARAIKKARSWIDRKKK